MKQYVSANQLTDAQTTWFVTQIIKYVPLHLLCLWQGFPEWSITQKQITEARIQFQVSTQRTDPRLLVFNMDGRRLDQIII